MGYLILIIGCFEVLYGMAQTYSGSEHIWWYKKVAHRNVVSGTYLNRNHFAGLMEMGILLATAYVAAISTKIRKREIISGQISNARVRISRFLSWEQKFNKRTLFLFAGAVMGIGLVFSASRGGLISACGGLFCMSLFLVFRKNHRRKGLIILIMFLIIAVYTLPIGIYYTLSRFKSFGDSFETRTRLAQKTMDLFGDYRLTGIGVGNFQYAYPKYQASEHKTFYIQHAHNDWSEFMAEAGIIGLCFLLAGFFYYVFDTMKLWKRRRDPFAICLGAAPLAVLTAVGIHSYSDYNLHTPANFILLMAIVAIGYSALHLERHHHREKTLYRHHVLPMNYKGISVLLMILVLSLWSGIWTVRHFMAECYCNTVPNPTLNRDQNPSIEEINKAIIWDRWNAEYWNKLAVELIRVRGEGLSFWNVKEGRKKQMEIIRALEKAVRLNPLREEYHMRLGLEYTNLWQDPDSSQRWMPAADLCMERAAYFAGNRYPYHHAMMGHYWIIRSKSINPADPAWEKALSSASWHYKKTLSLESGHERKRMIKEIKKNIRIHYPDEAFVKNIME
ncbi:MAG: O-antigen ligase family protein [Deltaproteobacteria bacterium]|nr:O-antigen ligase family protein [Deltaproteobacteria bacterium]